ncbi:MAG: N-acetylmuramoyl-L-alanine amidase [Bacteroidota bacterium]
MLKRILDFFARLFGTTASPPSSQPEGRPSPAEEELIVEDASDLGDVQIVTIQESDPDARIASRSIFDKESYDYTTDGPISMISPRYLWCLDNGHGKLQNGKRSPLFPDGTQFEEWEFNRDVVKRIAQKLDEIGIQYFNVVPEVEVGSFLKERVARANAKESPLGLPKIYLSIHANAFGNNNWVNGTKGIEVWHYPGNQKGKQLASAFQTALTQYLPEWKDRGLKSHQKGSSRIFYVLRKTSMPAVLTENGFYTDFEEASLLMQASIRQTIADAHVAAILRIEQEGHENIPIHLPNMVVGG